MLTMKVFHHGEPLSSMTRPNDHQHLIFIDDRYGEDGKGRIFCSMWLDFSAELKGCASILEDNTAKS